MSKKFQNTIGFILLLSVCFQNNLAAQYTNALGKGASEIVLASIESLKADSTRSEIALDSNHIIAQHSRDYLIMTGPDILKEIDGPVQIIIELDSKNKLVSKKTYSLESVNQPSGFVAITKMLVHNLSSEMIQYLQAESQSDQYIFTFSPILIKSKSEDYVRKERAMELVVGTWALDSDSTDMRIYRDKAIEPEFKGGVSQLNKFLYLNIIAPLKTQNPKLNKTLSYQFTVEKDGSLSNILAIANRGSDASLYGLKIVENKMPNWVPAAKSGNYVRSQYILVVPIKSVYTPQMIEKILNPKSD